MIHYYALDTETTGLKAGYHEVNQISCLRLSDGEIVTSDIKVNFPDRANPIALEIQGKTVADLDHGVGRKEGIQKIHDFIANDGHLN